MAPQILQVGSFLFHENKSNMKRSVPGTNLNLTTKLDTLQNLSNVQFCSQSIDVMNTKVQSLTKLMFYGVNWKLATHVESYI